MTVRPDHEYLPSPRHQLGDQLIAFASKMARVQEHVLERSPSELSYRPFRMMRRIIEGKNTITKIGEGSTITYSALSQSLRRLLDLRFVIQTPGPVDGREMELRLTSRGSRALAETQEILNDFSEKILQSLSDEQCERLNGEVETILLNLDSLAAEMGLRPAARARMARRPNGTGRGAS